MKTWLAVIGIGEDGVAGLSAAARTLIETAEILVGGRRHLDMVPSERGAERLVWERPLARTIDTIAAKRGRRVAVLASGDPLWYGVGAVLTRRFPPDEMIILPHPGAFSLAAAQLGWPLAHCVTISLHARPLDSLRLHLTPGRRILALSEDGETPGRLAALLTELAWGRTRLTVFGHLGGPLETVISEEARCWGECRVPDLNTIALECIEGPEARPLSRLAGLPDDAFENDGQLTKREVRAATLAALAPMADESLWDIGAGCGSIAIEWLRAGERCAAVAVERDPSSGGDDRAQRRIARRARIACRCRFGPRGGSRLGVAGCDLCRRRDRRTRIAAGPVGGVAAGWAACRQCGDRRERGTAVRVAIALRRGIDPHCGQPGRACRGASDVAATCDRHPTGAGQVRLR